MANFTRFATFSNLFPPKWLRMTRNGQFCLICNFSNFFPLKGLRMTQNGQFQPDLQLFQSFPTKVAKNDSEWPISPDSQLFQSFPTEVAQNDSEWPILHLICNFSHLFPLKWLRMTWNSQFCMAKIKNTLIQGNFCERLPFYMDSCALSPTAS